MAIKPIEILIRAKDEASSVFDLFKRNAAGVGAAIAGYFGFNAFAGAVKGAADLEAALSEVAAVSGAGAGEMGKLRAAAEEAGAATKYTATEAAVALGNLARAGLDSNQAIAALKPTLQLAQAGSIDLGQAAEITTKTIAGFGLAATDAGRIADVLAKGANASNTSVRGLGEAMSYAAPMAKTVGLDLESTVAIMGKFADGGIDASRAGTALNSILSQFADPSSKFKAALSDAGITTLDFNKALVQLAAKGKDGEKAMLAVGTEAGPALRSLLNQGIPALNELRAKLADAGGSAEATAKIMGDNLKGAMDGLSSAWDAVKVKLTTPVLPVLKSAVDSLAAAFKDAVDSGVVAKFGAAIATGFEAAITWAKAFAEQVDFAALGETMRGYATQVGEAFTEIKNAATTAGDVVRLVWGAMSAGTNAVLAGVYAVGAGFATMAAGIQANLAGIMAGFAKVTFGSVSASFKAAADEMQLSANATSAAAVALGTKAVDAFGRMATSAQTARNGWTGLTADSTSASTTFTGTVSPAIKQTAAALEAMGGVAQAAGQKAAQAAVAQKEAAEQARAKVAELRAEYEKAVATGNFQKAAEVLGEIERAAKAGAAGIAGLSDDAKEKADAIAAAFAAMGVKTKAELQDIASNSKKQFDLMKESGESTAQGLRTAFAKTAADAIAANNGIAPSWVQAQAAANGYKLVLDEMGNTTLVNLKSATDGNTQSVNNLAAAHAAGAQAAREWAQAQTEAGAAARAAKLTDAELEADLSGDKYGNRPGGLPARSAALSEDYKRRKAKGQDAEGFSVDSSGKRIEAKGTNPETYLAILRQMGYDIKDPAAQSAAESVSRQITSALNSHKGVGFSGQGISKTPEQLLRQEMSTRKRAVAYGDRQPSADAPTGGAAKTYNVQIGGRTIKTASDADAQSLIGALKDAQRAA